MASSTKTFEEKPPYLSEAYQRQFMAEVAKEAIDDLVRYRSNADGRDRENRYKNLDEIKLNPPQTFQDIQKELKEAKDNNRLTRAKAKLATLAAFEMEK